MELIWIIAAAFGAGVGTGLAGLSAATVMVPVLFVMCPSFAGETGAYQATAIALASDILGSAVTAWTYAKNGNIDLKRGWIMLACITVMCMAGSYAAFLAGREVLGSFTLFLTLCIGIRFLVKPDTARGNTAAKGEKLDWKGIAISIFFGLTIGFGTGFVGTGGGMMMLIVFTVFLGMDLKTAVGTSTFIMTFTALIASVSHILIHPAIILEKWHIMLICVVIATASSLYTARFANRISSRTAGFATGVVLTVLGSVMLLLYYRPVLSKLPLVHQTLHCLGTLIIYLIPCATVSVLLRFLTPIPDFVFRKILHVIAFSCFSVMLKSAANWQAAALTSVVMAVMIYPLLLLAEKQPWFDQLFVQKSKGEVKNSLLMLFFMFAAIVTAAWGIFHKQAAASAAILMWGVGDACAALIGIPFGKHKILSAPVNGRKSWEGSAAMLVSSFLAGILLLTFVYHFRFAEIAGPVLAAAAACAVTEMLTPGEWDTVTVPTAAAVILILLLP